MPFLPLQHEGFSVECDPFEDFVLYPRRPGSFELQCLKEDEDIEAASGEVDVRWLVVALPYLESVLVPKAVLGGHWVVVWKRFLVVKGSQGGRAHTTATSVEKAEAVPRADALWSASLEGVLGASERGDVNKRGAMGGGNGDRVEEVLKPVRGRL